MKIGYRKPSIKKSISSRTTGRISRSVNKAVNSIYGKKGAGIINDPKKAVYNKVYNNSTYSLLDLLSDPDASGCVGCGCAGIVILLVLAVLYMIVDKIL